LKHTFAGMQAKSEGIPNYYLLHIQNEILIFERFPLF
jgi:hypothetical protein